MSWQAEAPAPGVCTFSGQVAYSDVLAPRRISESRLWVLVGQVVNLRRIGNPPAALGRAAATFGGTPAPFVACRYAEQVVNLRPIGNRPLDFREILSAIYPLSFRDHFPSPPAAPLSFRGPGHLCHMAPAWQPPAESLLSLVNRLWTSLPRHGPYTRLRMHRPAFLTHNRTRQDGDGCHLLSGSRELSPPRICRHAEPRSSPDDSTGGSFPGDAISQKVHCPGGQPNARAHWPALLAGREQ